MDHPFFSVLVPVYNVERYLEECLESLVGQTFDDYEVILVDDGSTDRSGQLCDLWQAKYPQKLKVIHQKNGGLVMARSTGMRNARGEFLVFVDSDDLLRYDALQIIHQYAVEHSADMVIYGLTSDRGFSIQSKNLSFAGGEVFNVRESEKFRTYMGSTFLLNNICGKAVKREIVQTHKDYSPFSYIRDGEDLMFSLPMVDRAECVVYCDHPLYYYRTNPDSITHSYFPGKFRSQRDVLRMQREYAMKWDPTGELARKCDANGLWHFADDVLVRIVRSNCSRADKRRYILEMVNDADFQRDYQYIGQLKDKKARISLFLAKHKILWPLFLYGEIRNIIQNRA